MKKDSRRLFLNRALGGATLGILGQWIPNRSQMGWAQPPRQEPAKILHVVLPEGFDVHSLFDARPLSFRAAGWIQNYDGVEPVRVYDRARHATWMSPAAKRFWDEYHPYLSVLNGVYQAPGFDGHEQNMNYCFTGNPFGGDYFLNVHPMPITGMRSIQFEPNINLGVLLQNTQDSLDMEPKALLSFLKDIKFTPTPLPMHPWHPLLQQQAKAQAQTLGQGLWSQGLTEFATGLGSLDSFVQQLKSFPGPMEIGTDPFVTKVELAASLLQSGITPRVQITLVSDSDLPEVENADFDAHSDTDCARYPKVAQAVLRRLGQLIDGFRRVPSGSTTLWDDGMVIITSEFGRTMRQSYAPIDQSGTDHNPYTGLCLVGGKGIQSGLILGATDAAELNPKGELDGLNAFHSTHDRDLVMAMGTGFDFRTGECFVHRSPVLPRHEVLTIDSVINTLFYLAQIPQDHWRKVDGRPSGEQASVVYPLLM